MSKLRRAALICAVAGTTLSVVGPTFAASPIRDQGGAAAHRVDNRPGPLTAQQDARRKAAQELIRSGQRSPNSDGVVALDEGKYVEAVVTGPAKLFTILAEFGSEAAGRYGTVPGPLHNEIPKPNREIVDGQANPDYSPAAPYDNFRAWTADFNEAYYRDQFFGATDSMKHFYLQQSNGA